MPINRKLLEILVCPVTKQPLSKLDDVQLAKVNRAIEQGAVHSLDGVQLRAPLQAALVTQNGETIYAVDGGVPVLLEGKGIAYGEIVDTPL